MTKMFQYLMKFEKEFEFLKENTATKADVDKIMTILDQDTQILQTHELERHALQAQVEQLQSQGYRVRLFAGYASWSPLQLEVEMWLARLWQTYQPARVAARLNPLFDGSSAVWAALHENR